MNPVFTKKSIVQVFTGDPQGVLVIGKKVWPGEGILFPRSVFATVRQMKELENVGIYILWNGFYPGIIPSVYIGQSGNLRERLDHNNKGFWTHCVAFYSKDRSLMKGHVEYLEAELVTLAKEAKCCRFEGKVEPKHLKIPEGEKIFADDFLYEMLQCLSIVGVRFFEVPGVWIPLSSYTLKEGARVPAAIRFWDQSSDDINFWYQVLTLSVEKLYGDDHLKIEETPINLGKQTYLIHKEPIHPTGKKFWHEKQVGLPPLYIETKLGAASVLKYTASLLQKCNIDTSTVHLKI